MKQYAELSLALGDLLQVSICVPIENSTYDFYAFINSVRYFMALLYCKYTINALAAKI